MNYILVREFGTEIIMHEWKLISTDQILGESMFYEFLKLFLLSFFYQKGLENQERTALLKLLKQNY